MSISTVIITFNEESNIVKCIESVLTFSEKIIIVDSFSTDKTKELATKYEKVVFFEHVFEDYISQKNRGNSHVLSDYIFSIDADEWCSNELIDYFNKNKNSLPEIIKFQRKNYYCGQLIKYGSWNPDIKTRLWKNELATWGGKIPHEHLVFNSNHFVFNSPFCIYHNSYNTVKSHFYKSLKYAELAAKNHLSDSNYTKLVLKLIFSPFVRFIKGFFIKKGILNGVYGLVIEFMISFETFYKYSLAIKYKFNKK